MQGIAALGSRDLGPVARNRWGVLAVGLGARVRDLALYGELRSVESAMSDPNLTCRDRSVAHGALGKGHKDVLIEEIHDDRLLSVDEAAELLQMSPYMIRQWARDRKIPAIRMGGRYWRFRRSSLNAWIREQERPSR